MTATVAILAADPSQVAAARQAVQRLVHSLEFDETRAGRAAIVASEMVSNLVKHAGSGTFTARRLERRGALGIEMLAVDAGPGMDDYANSARDGVSTTGTAGTGLGAISRLADECDVHTAPGHGTIVRAALWNQAPAPGPGAYEVGAILVPKPPETSCGDGWTCEIDDQGLTLLVADGLGHGPDAERASASAVEVVRRHPHESAIRILDLAHARLRSTRGAAAAAVKHPAGAAELTFAGVGNIAAWAIDGASRRAMVSHNGIVGHTIHKSNAYAYPWPVGALLVAHSDGLESQWDLAAIPGIAAAHPALVAAALYRRHWRKRDDVVVVVVRRKE